MVKPTLKPEPEKEKKEINLKDDNLKEWGVLPATVVIDETEKEKDKKDAEAAIAGDDYMTDVAGSRPSFVKCCACIAVLTLLLIITCTIGSFLYFSHANSEHKWKGWCSVKYGDDHDSSSSEENGRHGGYHGDRNHGNGDRHHPYGNDALYPPSGPPPSNGRTCNQESEVDLDNRLERIDRPREQDCERITILHDYNANISAYRLWQSEICYITWIDQDILMNPEEFYTNMQDPAYLNQWFEELEQTYYAVAPAIPTPLHEQENGKYGEYLDGPKEYLCQGVTTYWIQKVSEEKLEEFLRIVEEIVQEFVAMATEMENDGMNWQGIPTDLPNPMLEDFNPMDERWPMEGMQGEHPSFPVGEHPRWPAGGHTEGHGRHHGGHRHGDGHDGHRQRRDTGGLMEKARKIGVQGGSTIIKEIAGHSSILSKKVITPEVMEKVREMFEKKGKPLDQFMNFENDTLF